MPKRLITALVAALALVAVAPASSGAQTPTPTPTATARPGSPPANASAAVKKIYNDYTSDGKIDVCKHARDDLQKALDTIEVEFDTDYPDFREALKAGIQRHDKGRCDDDEATAAPTATATAAPSASAEPSSAPESGALPPDTGGGSGDDGGDAVTPEPETGTLPPAETTTPAPTPSAAPTVPPAAAAAPTASPTPVILTHSNTGKLLVPGIIVAIALLGGALLGAWAFAARRNPRWAHAWDEAGYRVKSTWADFSDWLRLGR